MAITDNKFREVVRSNIADQPSPQLENGPKRQSIGHGYDGGIPISPEVLGFVPITIKDVDEAVYNLFDKKLKIKLSKDSGTAIDVSIRFAGRERFSLVQSPSLKGNETNMLQPPAIAIERSGYDISLGLNNMGRYLGQDIGELSFIRRLGSDDPRYQNLVNKFKIKNQDNVSVKTSDWVAERDIAKIMSFSDDAPLSRRRNKYKKYLNDNINQNVFEIIKIPFPKFFIGTYKITFWTTHMRHMRELIEKFVSSFDAAGNYFYSFSNSNHRIDLFCEDSLNFETNANDYSDVERDIKVSFELKANGRLVGTTNAEEKPAFRSYVSATRFDFGIDEEFAGEKREYLDVVWDRNGKLITNQTEKSKLDFEYYRLVYQNKKSGESVLKIKL